MNGKSSSIAAKRSRVATTLDGATRAFLDATPDAALYIEPSGAVLAANEVAAVWYKVATPAELVGRNYYEFIPAEVAAYRREKVAEALASGAIVRFEDDHDDRIAQHSVMPVPDGNGLFQALALVSTDLTLQRRSDEELRREQQRQIFYLESLPGFVFLLSKDYTLRYANRYFRQKFGRQKHLKCYAAIMDRDTPCPVCPALRVFETNSSAEWEWEHKNGRTYQAYAHPMTDVDLAPVVMVLGIDITARKAAEVALQQAQRYQKAILDNIPDMVWLKNEKGEIAAANHAFKAICVPGDEGGASTENYSDWNVEAVDLFSKRDEDVQRTGQPMTAEELLSDKDGQYRWYETVRIPIFDAEGKYVGMTGIARDITERKRVVDRLMYSHSEMERHVRERTQALEQAIGQLKKEIEERKRTQKKLAQAKKKADAATRAKSVFLANMSHEVRTPLNVIMGMAALALSGRGGCDEKRVLEMIKQAGDSLLTVINDILDFSKIEARKLVLESIDFDLYQTLELTRTIHSFQAQKKGLSLTLNLDPAVPRYVCGDPSRLSQVLNNLLANAAKFTKQGGISIEVRPSEPSAKAKPGLYVRFVVRDTGIGIPRDKQTLIFRSFEQVDGSITREFGGTGLGLSICKRLTQMMGGRLDLESEPGRGSAFSFVIRLQKGDPTKVRSGVDDREGAVGGIGPLRILLAEDNALNRELATLFLEARGHSLICATNGREALEILARERVDLVLMDIQMPEMDGETATRAIRCSSALATATDVPIIAMTAHALTGDRERFLQQGMSGYVSKPINLDRLQAEMARVMVGRKVESESAVATVAAAPCVPGPGAALPLYPGQEGRAGAVEALQGNEKLLERLERVFMRDAPKDMELLRQSVASGEVGDTTLVAHRMKGAAATIGATATSVLSKELEFAGKHQETASFLVMLERLDTAVAFVLAALAERLGSPAA